MDRLRLAHELASPNESDAGLSDSDQQQLEDILSFGERYGLTDDEQDRLAVEFAFFVTNPPTDDTRSGYWAAYQDAAEAIYFGHSDKLNDLGWRMRYGASADSVNTAMREPGGQYSFEHVIGRAADHLRYVLVNLNHRMVLVEQGLMDGPES